MFYGFVGDLQQLNGCRLFRMFCQKTSNNQHLEVLVYLYRMGYSKCNSYLNTGSFVLEIRTLLFRHRICGRRTFSRSFIKRFLKRNQRMFFPCRVLPPKSMLTGVFPVRKTLMKVIFFAYSKR